MGTTAILIVLASSVVLVATSIIPSILIDRSASLKSIITRSNRLRTHPSTVIAFYFLTLIALYFAEFYDQDLPLIAYLVGGASDSNLHVYGKDSKLQVIAFGIYSAAIFLFYLWLNERRPLRRTLYLILSFAVIGLGLFKASKSDIYIPIISYGALIYYHSRSRSQKVPNFYRALALAVALLVVSVTSIRLEGIGLSGGYAGLIDFRYSNELGASISEIVSTVYGYTALGFQNFSNYVNSHVVEFRIGTSLFRPFLSVFMMGSIADERGVPVDQWNVVSEAANTGTFLTSLYIEGGIVFCLLGSLLYGLIVNMVYTKFRRTNLLKWQLMYISLIFPWTWLFFANAFSVLSIYVNLFYILALSFVCISPNPVSKLIGVRIPISSRLAGIDSGPGSTRTRSIE
jgi:oligosaccharide repeat unit polymerase